MSNVVQEILLYSSSLTLGDNIRVICPACGGGTSSEKSLSITLGDNGVLKWQCFREKCNLTTGTVCDQWRHQQDELQTVKEKPIFNGITETLRDIDIEWIYMKWGIANPAYWYFTHEYGGRLALSIRSPSFTHRGWVLRDISGMAKTKAFTFIDNNEQSLSWYKTSPHKGTLIVEDIPSAVRASKYLNSVALCGTGIGIDRAVEIATYAPRPIYVALDNDAIALSFKWAKKFALLWDTVKVLPLTKDIKDLTITEASELLGDLK